MTGALLAAALAVAAPTDDALRAALDRLYDGGGDSALAELAELAAASPGDALPVYLGALALAWKIEERPASRALDAELERRAAQAQALAEAALARDPGDPRARLARAGAFGVRSRLHLLRREAGAAARSAAQMRAELLVLRGLGGETADADFGLGLYDYYADVLPRPMKLLRLLSGLPGGDRRRGLAEIERAARGAAFHATEAQAQLYDIYAFWEQKPDLALAEARALHARYPAAPLWGLRLAEHLRERLGLYAESAGVAQEVLDRSRAGHPHFAPVTGALARLALGEALLADLRLEPAREALAALAAEAWPEAPQLVPRARLLLGRTLELQGLRAQALPHYQAAAAGPPDVRRQAQAALRAGIADAERRGRAHLAAGRRLREAGRDAEAAAEFRAALAAAPREEEAALRVAEADPAPGAGGAARATLERLASRERTQPPWLLPWARLLLAEALERDGERAGADQLYKRVWEEPYGQPELRARAARGLGLAPPAASPAPSRRSRPVYSN